jgi:hypothetical protein
MADETAINPDAIDAAAVLQKPKKKVSIWTKVFAIVVMITMVGWVLAAYMDKGTNNSNSNNNGNTSLVNISGYSIYALSDGTFGTFIKDNSGKQIPVAFRLDPRNASNISIDNTSVKQILDSKKIYIVVDPDETELGKIAVAAAEISRIPPLYGITVVGAYSKDSNPPNPNVPIRTCSDASNATSTSIIYLNVGNSTGIENTNGCIHIDGKTADDLILAADKLGYNLVGIRI